MNRNRYSYWVAMVFGVGLAGCQVSPFDADLKTMATSATSPMPSSTKVRSEMGKGVDLEPGAGVEAYVKLVLERNPSIRAAIRRTEEVAQRVPQVTSLDDPMFRISPIGEMAQTAAGEVEVMTGASQKLPFPGKLRTKGKIVQRQIAMAQADVQTIRLRVVADTRRAYWNYHYATRALEVTVRNRSLMKQFYQIAQVKYKAASASQPDVLRASTELSNIDNELITWEQRKETAIAMLNQLMDQPVTQSLPDPPKAKLNKLSLELDSLLHMASVTNPALKKIHEQIEKARSERHLADLDRWPDLTVGVNYNAVSSDGLAPMSTGQDQWWITLGINVPLWQQKRTADRKEAIASMRRHVARLTAEHNRVAFRVQDAFLKVDTQQRLVILFRDVIIPQAKQTVQASRSAYRAGATTFLTLVDNWRKQLDFELLYHRNLAQFEQNFAELQQFVGTDLNRTMKENRHDDE